MIARLKILTDLKRIQTPHSLFWDFGADKTLQPIKCNLSEERESPQIQIEQHSDFGWRSAKALKQRLA